MGLFDNVKARLGPAKDKVSDLADQQGTGSSGASTGRRASVDEKTGGKYRDRITDRLGEGEARDGAGWAAVSRATRATSRGGSATGVPEGRGCGVGVPTAAPLSSRRRAPHDQAATR
ncbi:antitoxin [Streptomyces sp. PG2]